MKEIIRKIVAIALQEDVGRGDITTNLIVPKDRKAGAVILAKEDGVIAGLAVAREVFGQIDGRIVFKPLVKDGAKVKKGKVIARLSGPAGGILTGERVALNFLQRLSGIATLTRAFVDKAGKVKILDTRKTTPGLRALEKYAVKMGGGENHRMGLYDAILIKDNHIKVAGGIDKAIIMGTKGLGTKGLGIEVEAKNIGEVKKATKLNVKRILLDNMNIKTLREAVKLCKVAGIMTEASGGVRPENVKAIAKTGVNYISIGALTHSSKALDISLETL